LRNLCKKKRELNFTCKKHFYNLQITILRKILLKKPQVFLSVFLKKVFSGHIKWSIEETYRDVLHDARKLVRRACKLLGCDLAGEQ